MMNENQKKTTDEFRKGWDQIFGNKKEKADEDKSTPPGGRNQQGLGSNGQS